MVALPLLLVLSAGVAFARTPMVDHSVGPELQHRRMGPGWRSCSASSDWS